MQKKKYKEWNEDARIEIVKHYQFWQETLVEIPEWWNPLVWQNER